MREEYENWDLLSLMSELRICPDEEVHHIQELIPKRAIYDAIKQNGFAYFDMGMRHYAIIHTQEARRCTDE